MIVEEKNKARDERNKVKKIFEMLKDVKLPKHYYFVDDCVEIRFIRFFIINIKIAEIDLDEDILEVNFIDEEELNKLRDCFAKSNTKFKLVVKESYY